MKWEASGVFLDMVNFLKFDNTGFCLLYTICNLGSPVHYWPLNLCQKLNY